MVNSIHYGYNDNCIAVAWNILPPLQSIVRAVRCEESRIRAHNAVARSKGLPLYMGVISLAAVTVRAARYSVDLEHIRACLEDALTWVADYVRTVAKCNDASQDQIGDGSFGLCSKCNIMSYPTIDDRNWCHRCWTASPKGSLHTSLSYEGIYMHELLSLTNIHRSH